MKLTFTINTDNEAFGEDEYDKTQEVAGIIRSACTKAIGNGLWSDNAFLRDLNGNHVGTLKVEDV